MPPPPFFCRLTFSPLSHFIHQPSALDSLQLPVAVKAGFIGELKLKIPWTSLGGGSAPISLSLDNIQVLVVPNAEVSNVLGIIFRIS